MKKNIFLLCCLFTGGCTVQTIAEPPVLGGQGTGMSQSLKDSRLTRINSVRVGMTSREVAATMGKKRPSVMSARIPLPTRIIR